MSVPIVVSSVRWEEACDGFVPSGAVCGGKTFDRESIYIGRTRLLENRNELTPGILIPSDGHLNVSYGTGVRTSREYEVLVASDPSSVCWVPCSCGQVPVNAVIGGIDCSYLEPYYIGKTRGNLSLGRTWRGHRFTIGSQENNSSSLQEGPSSGGREFIHIVSSDTKCSKEKSEGNWKQEGSHDIDKVTFPGKVHRTHRCLYIPYNDKEYLFRDYEVLTLTTSPQSLMGICKFVLREHLLGTIDTDESGIDLAQSNATLLEDAEDDVEKNLTRKIDALPLPSKVKKFCKEGTE